MLHLYHRFKPAFLRVLILSFSLFVCINTVSSLCFLLNTLFILMMAIQIPLSVEVSLGFLNISRLKLLSHKTYTIIQKSLQLVKPNSPITRYIIITPLLVPLHHPQRMRVEKSKTGRTNGLTLLIVLVQLLFVHFFLEICR